MNTRPLIENDIRAYTKPNTVFAVRLFRSRSRRWLAGKLWKINLDGSGKCKIHLNGYVEIGHHFPITNDGDPDKIFENFYLIAGSLSGDDRDFCFSDPSVNDNWCDSLLDIKSVDGSVVISDGLESIKLVEAWLACQDSKLSRL